MIFDLLYLLSPDESEFLDNEFDDDVSDSGSSVTYSFCVFYLHFVDSIGSISVYGSGVFAPTGVESKCDIFAFDVFVPIRVESKGSRTIEMFWRSNSLFPLQI